MHRSPSISDWNLAQINVGRLVAPRGDQRVAPFFDALDRINALADRSPGFIWRLQSEAGNATDIQTTFDSLFLVNMSLWSDAEALVARKAARVQARGEMTGEEAIAPQNL